MENGEKKMSFLKQNINGLIMVLLYGSMVAGTVFAVGQALIA